MSMRLWLTLLLLVMTLPAQAAGLDMSRFRELPVLEEGRLKPLESFAANMRTRLAGTAQPDGLAPATWLAQTMFDPAQAADTPTFRVANAHLRAMFQLTDRPNRLYSLAELAGGLAGSAEQAQALAQRDATTLTRDEQELLQLHTHVLMYNQLLQAFSLVLPLPFPAPAGAGLDDQASFLEAQKIEPALSEQVRTFLTPDLIDHPERLTPVQQQQAAFLHGLQQLREGGSHNQLVRVIPSSWNGGQDWYAPWQLVLGGQGSPAAQDILTGWTKLALAYRAGDPAAWTDSARTLSELVYYNQSDSLLQHRLHIETLYRDWNPLDLALILFALGAGLGLIGLKRPGWMRAAPILLFFGTLALAIAVAGRIYIMQRPPVGTLYESVLFVALVIATIALLLSRRQPRLALIGCLGPLALLFIAPLVRSDSESMTMLNAVLNTNFWLTVHVLCITAGYGACALTSLVAHGLLLGYGRTPAAPARLDLLHRLSLVALLLTATGTLLGGVWADQSWGRFWGWDPKENGALIIVLWLIWLQHGRLAGQIGELAYITGLAALAVVVAQAWFGVNLLSTGLHSYGFIEGIALGLFSYTAANLLLIALLWGLARRRLHHAA